MLKLTEVTVKNYEHWLFTLNRIEKVLSRMEKTHPLYEEVEDVIDNFKSANKMASFEKALIISLIAKGY